MLRLDIVTILVREINGGGDVAFPSLKHRTKS